MSDIALQEAIDDWRGQAHSWEIAAGEFRRRAEAAEAKLEAIRQGTADLYIERDRLQARVKELEAELGETDMDVAVTMMEMAAVEAMRARAAILADNHGDPELRDAILALPLEETSDAKS